MRPKITFRNPRAKRSFRVDAGVRIIIHPNIVDAVGTVDWGPDSDMTVQWPNDEGLDDVLLSELISIWRAKYQRFKDRAITPLRMDVRATLKKLTKIPDSATEEATRLLDSETYAKLKHAAWLDFRSANPKPIPIPSDELSIQPDRVRKLAALALLVMKEDTGGRPRINSLDYLFARELVHHWTRINNKKPTVHSSVSLNGTTGTDFTRWAAKMFNLVDAPRKDHTKVLKRAINNPKLTPHSTGQKKTLEVNVVRRGIWDI